MATLVAPLVTPFAYGRKAAFSMEFDDSMDSHVKNVLPLLAQYRFPATFYINPGRTNYRPEIWEKAVPAAGHELGDHTMHHGDTVGAEQGAKEIGDAAKVIERALGHPVLTPFGTPGGVKWEIPEVDFQRILKENRLFFPGRQDFYMDDQGDILRFPKLALEKGIWRQLGFHGVGGEWLSTSVAHLTTLLQFLDAHRNEIWVAPTGTIWKYQQEREAVTGIDSTREKDGSVRLTLRFDKAKLAPFELFDVPLTVRTPVSGDWKKVWVVIDGHRKQMATNDGRVDLQVSPQVKSIQLENAPGVS
ncbi:hypothetical protein BH11ARM2_BH11ARM2_01270 [soil metagenome]